MKLSIIVPVYNVQRYLDECVQSIVSQTFTDWECILVDDGSTDGSGAMCDEWAKKDSRIKVIHKSNGGLGSARNAGISVANGDFVAFVDSDDFVSENIFSFLFEKISANDLDAVWCALYRFFDDDPVTASVRHIPNMFCTDRDCILNKMFLQIISADNFSTEIPGTMCAAVYKKGIILENNLSVPDSRLTNSEDNHFNLMFLPFCERVMWVDEPLYYYRNNASSLSNSVTASKVDAINNFASIAKELAERHCLDENLILRKIKTRTMVSFSRLVKKLADSSTLKSFKYNLSEFYSILDVDIFPDMSYIRAIPLKVSVFSILVCSRMYTVLYLLIKMYSLVIKK